MLANNNNNNNSSRQRSVSSSDSVLSESEESLCCCRDGADDGELESRLESLAMGVVAGMVESAVVTPLPPAATACLATYLQALTPSLVTTVMMAVVTARPRWLPLEYHWAPVDHDPLLTLLPLLGTRLTALTYTCHPLSRDPLLAALSGLPGLTCLSLPDTTDDNTLAVVGAGCPLLACFSVRGSRAVTDDGLRRLLLQRHTYTRSRWRRLFSRWRALRSSITRQHSRYRPLPPAALGDPTLLPTCEPDHLNSLAATLTRLDLAGTRVTEGGREWTTHLLPPGAVVCVTRPSRRSLRSQASLEDQMARLLAPLTP